MSSGSVSGHVCSCYSTMRPPSRRLCVFVVAPGERGRGDVLRRAPLVQAEQSVQQVVDVRLQALSLHPVLQQLVDFVPRGPALGDADVVVADADHSKELVVDPHVQVLVEQVKALLEGFFRACENRRETVECKSLRLKKSFLWVIYALLFCSYSPDSIQF